jgi:hypothetical protein
LGVAQATVRLVDAEGNEVAREQVTSTPAQPARVSFGLDHEALMGPLTLEVSGPGVYTVGVEYAITYDDHPFLVLTWDEVALS